MQVCFAHMARSTAQKNDQSNHPEGDNCADGNPHPEIFKILFKLAGRGKYESLSFSC